MSAYERALSAAKSAFPRRAWAHLRQSNTRRLLNSGICSGGGRKRLSFCDELFRASAVAYPAVSTEAPEAVSQMNLVWVAGKNPCDTSAPPASGSWAHLRRNPSRNLSASPVDSLRVCLYVPPRDVTKTPQQRPRYGGGLTHPRCSATSPWEFPISSRFFSSRWRK